MGLRTGNPLKIAVIGYKNSGKTYVVELVTRVLRNYDLKILTVKHIHDKLFSIDREGSDSWRMRSAGADAVMIVAPKELSIIRPLKVEIDYKDIFPPTLTDNYDVIIIEGFKDKTLKDPDIAKILCVKGKEELDFFNLKVRGDIIASCSLGDLNNLTLVLGRDDDELKRRIIEYFEYYVEVRKIMEQLPKLDCGKCGYSSCIEMAKVIHEGKRKLEDCRVISSSIDVEVKIDGSKIPLQPFVAKIIKSTILGMLSSLKGVDIKGDEKLKLNIYKR